MPSSAARSFVRLLFTLVLLLLPGCGIPTTPSGARDPGAVTVDGQLGTPILLATGQSTVYARIRIGTAPRPAKARGPVNVALAVDTSGSMEGAAIQDAREAGIRMIDALKDGDRLAVVVFHSRTEVLLPSTELDQDVRQEIKAKLAAIEARGTTDMAGGLDAALDQVRAHANPKGINRVILLGDGIPNKASNIEYTARRAAEGGISITAMGLGLDYDETLMGKIAELSGGRYRYIESSDKVAAFFSEELDRLDFVYGRQVSARITPGPGVHIDSVVGGATPSPGGTAYLSLGDITRGDTRDVVVRMTVTPRKAGVPIELLDVTVAFDDALENAGRIERYVYLGAQTTEDEATVVKAKNPEIELAAAIAEASATTLTALDLGKRGQYVRAREMLTKGADAARAQAKRTPSAALEKHASDMVAVAKDMPEADTPAPRAAPEAGYQFDDDSLNAESVAPAQLQSAPPSVVRKRKQVHQDAYESLH